MAPLAYDANPGLVRLLHGVLADLSPPDAATLTTRLLDGKVWLVHAVIVRVIDGDTVVVKMDLGWHTWRHDEHVRLNGVDAPERSNPDRLG